MPSGPTKRFRGSISIRIAFLFWATFVIGLASAFLFAYIQLNYSLERSTKEVIAAKLRQTAGTLNHLGVVGLRKYFSEENHRILNAHYYIRVLTNSGDTLYLKPSSQEKGPDFTEPLPKEESPEKLLGWRSLPIDHGEKYDILTEKVGDSLYLQVGDSSEDRDEILDHIMKVFEIVGGIFIILSGGFGIWYARKSLAPIRDLVSTIQGIEKGDFAQRVVVGDTLDELRDLGETFNRMVARIERLIQVMRESLDNVAHDIRTPLTRIRAVAEDALLSGNSASLREALEDCAESAINISELVDQLMSISEAEAGTLPLRYESCNVKMLLEDVVEVYEFVAHEKQIAIVIAPLEENLFWDLDRKRIKQVIANLLDNAIKFSPDHTTISLSAGVDEQNLKISVKDQGQGIAEGDLARIWDRLFRGDKSRSTQGLGLGLSIVRSIVIAHGGFVEVRSDPEGGTLFTIALPRRMLKS